MKQNKEKESHIKRDLVITTGVWLLAMMIIYLGGYMPGITLFLEKYEKIVIGTAFTIVFAISLFILKSKQEENN